MTEPMTEPAIKACGCGRRHSLDGWRALPLVHDGRLDEDCASSGIELRNCPCGSTLGLMVAGAPVAQRSTGRRGTVAPWVADEWSERNYARVIWSDARGRTAWAERDAVLGSLVDVTAIDVVHS